MYAVESEESDEDIERMHEVMAEIDNEIFEVDSKEGKGIYLQSGYWQWEM